METDFIWTDGIEFALNDIKKISFDNSEYHKNNYYFFKGYLKYFRVPTIILSGLNSVFSVGLQPYVSQGIISILCCSISLICGIIASVELFLGIQNMMEKELISSKEFYILSSDISKMLSIERQYRYTNGKIYLDNIHTKYCYLIERCNLLNKNDETIKLVKTITNGESKEVINKIKGEFNRLEDDYNNYDETIQLVKYITNGESKELINKIKGEINKIEDDYNKEQDNNKKQDNNKEQYNDINDINDIKFENVYNNV